jgi:hypothetical protein
MKASSSPPSLRAMFRSEKTVPKISLALSPALDLAKAMLAVVVRGPLAVPDSWDGVFSGGEGGVIQSLEYIHSAGGWRGGVSIYLLVALQGGRAGWDYSLCLSKM